MTQVCKTSYQERCLAGSLASGAFTRPTPDATSLGPEKGCFGFRAAVHDSRTPTSRSKRRIFDVLKLLFSIVMPQYVFRLSRFGIVNILFAFPQAMATMLRRA